MRSFALLLAGAAYATEDEPMAKPNCWPANDHAPYCGCQLISDKTNMINATCTATFPKKTHFVSVASAFAIPEQSDTKNDKYVWTGFQGNSHENLHDILYFFEKKECIDGDGEYINKTMMAGADWDIVFDCDANIDGDGNSFADPNVRLGNFVYDIARSVQRYNLPIKNLALDQSVTIQINKQDRQGVPIAEGVELRNVSAHHGHGEASAEDCSNDGSFVYSQNPDHLGDLEYAQFDVCDTGAEDTDYDWDVPSSWESEVIV